MTERSAAGEGRRRVRYDNETGEVTISRQNFNHYDRLVIDASGRVRYTNGPAGTPQEISGLSVQDLRTFADQSIGYDDDSQPLTRGYLDVNENRSLDQFLDAANREALQRR